MPSRRRDDYSGSIAGGVCVFAPELGEIALTHSIYESTLSAHRHEFVELVCISGGCGIHIINGKPTRTRRGDIFLIERGIYHNYLPLSEDFEWINCIFRPEDLCKSIDTHGMVCRMLWTLSEQTDFLPDDIPATLFCNLRTQDEDMTPVFENMLLECDKKLYGYADILQHYLYLILRKLARQIFPTTIQEPLSQSSQTVMEDVIRVINSASPGMLSAKQIASSYFMSPSAFSENFKRHMGCSYMEYVTELRIRCACELLLTTDCTIYEIQSRVGYKDAKSFYRVFRKYTGQTPTEYRAAKK